MSGQDQQSQIRAATDGRLPHYPASPALSTSPIAFLSYSHTEKAIARAFRDALASRGLQVLFDDDHLKPGEDISDFARRSVRAADATVCVISKTSLLSAWVVFEAVSTLHREQADSKTRLIACATDHSYFAPGFHLEATRSIEERLSEIDRLVPEYLARKMDFQDLSVQRSRLMKMRDSLGDVLLKLRESLTLDLELANVVEIATRVADHIRNLRGQAPSRVDPRDVRERAEQLRELLLSARTDDALRQTFDFATDFSDGAKRVKYRRDVTFIGNTLRRIDMLAEKTSLSLGDAEAQRQPAIYKLLELIDDIELHPDLPVAS